MASRRRSSDGSSPALRPVVVFVDRFPVLSETFVEAEVRELARLGHDVRVIAGGRGDTASDVAVTYLGAATGRVVSPRDVLDRRRWLREEPARRLRELAPAVAALRRPGAIAHAHFAAGAALDALRAARIAGVPFSLTAHAYDVYAKPRNLREKLRAAAVVTSGCDYTVRDLERIGGRPVHKVVMGVDPGRFRRRTPAGRGDAVLAVGRLVPKKGFLHLVGAAARLPGVPVRIVGEGPERGRLEEQVARLGLQDRVQLLGARPPEEVRELLEAATVLAMPCVVAPDGDRDSLPVVVKEALAMEVPVVASDEVGLPELVRPQFGRLTPPGDEQALAGALAEVLALAPSERATMGAAGRRHVARHANVHVETARLSELLESAR